MPVRRLILAVLFLFLQSAHAGGLPAAGSAAPASSGPGHAWVAFPLPGPGDVAAIVHLPPRRIGADPATDPATGSVRLARRLAQMPERLAAWQNQLFIVFPAEEASPGKRQRRVVRLSAEEGPVEGAWSAEPQGRLPALPSLSGEGSLDGFVGSARGPVALLRAKANSSGTPRYSLVLYAGAGWRIVTMPGRWWSAGKPDAGAPVSGSSPRLELASTPLGLVLFVLGGDNPGLWQASLPRWPEERDINSALAIDPEWSFTPLSFTTADGAEAPRPYTSPMLVASQPVYVARSTDGRTAQVWKPAPDACRIVQTIRGVGEDIGVVSLDQVGRMAILWHDPAEESGRARPGPGGGPSAAPSGELHIRIAEISLLGEVLYSGPAKVGPPISPEELKLLAAVLVGVMAVVLLFVLRSDGSGPPLTLPKGVVLAEPGRRIVAGLIDLSVAALATSRLARSAGLENLSASSFLRDPAALEAILMLIGIGILHSALGEWLFGRSIGKALTGCEVVRPRFEKAPDGEVVIVLDRPSLWRALVRNLVRWSIPPLALSGMSGMDHRHRGDTAAGTAVIIRARPAD